VESSAVRSECYFLLPIFRTFDDTHRRRKAWAHLDLRAVKLNAFNDLTGGTEANASKRKQHRLESPLSASLLTCFQSNNKLLRGAKPLSVRLAFPFFHGLAVDIHCGSDIRMTHEFLLHFNRCPGFIEQGSKCVTERVPQESRRLGICKPVQSGQVAAVSAGCAAASHHSCGFSLRLRTYRLNGVFSCHFRSTSASAGSSGIPTFEYLVDITPSPLALRQNFCSIRLALRSAHRAAKT
jgi:hypothetical protein